MYQHLILIYSSFTTKKRISYHYCCDKISDSKEFLYNFEKLKKQFSHITLGFHHLQLSDKSWECVIDYDKYFSDVVKVEEYKEFKSIIAKDTLPSVRDIAKAILSRRDCTHLELQKLLYFYWCEYFKKYKKDIFENDFQAWKYGPVIPEIYDNYKIYGKEKIHCSDNEKLIISSRLVSLVDYNKIIRILDIIMEKYEKHGASALVDKTHESGTPWDVVYRKGDGENSIIPKDLIINYMEIN